MQGLGTQGFTVTSKPGIFVRWQLGERGRLKGRLKLDEERHIEGCEVKDTMNEDSH